MPGSSGREDMDPIEIELSKGSLDHGDMGIMRRIKGAAKDTDA